MRFLFSLIPIRNSILISEKFMNKKPQNKISFCWIEKNIFNNFIINSEQ